jgi:hypothetical protein
MVSCGIISLTPTRKNKNSFNKIIKQKIKKIFVFGLNISNYYHNWSSIMLENIISKKVFPYLNIDNQLVCVQETH